jgi:phenylacetate-CoA ligase
VGDQAADVTYRSPRYWNESIEALAPEHLRRLEDEKLQRQLAYLRETSPFYHAKWDAVGVDASEVKTSEELARLPFTEKFEFQETQATCPPLGANQCAPLDRLIRMQATGGTSGRPLRMGMTRQDVETYNEVGARAAWLAGLRPGDVLFECMNYSLYAGGVNDHMTFEHLGACVAPVGIGHSRRLIEILRDVRVPVAIYSTPSYALHLAEVARQDGIEPGDLGIRKGFFSGDAGLGIPEYRQEVEQTWGLVARDIYGLGELGAVAAECEHGAGLHWVGQGLFIVELVDPDSDAPLQFADGAVGELAFTTLEREAHPMIRFRSHDHVQIMTTPCACGRAGFRFHILGRSDDMFIVKGINVYPLGVQDVLLGMRPALTGEFQIVLRKPPPITENPLIRVEYGQGVTVDELDGLRERVAGRVRDVLVFTPDVELLSAGSLPRSERKAKRLFRTYRGEQP